MTDAAEHEVRAAVTAALDEFIERYVVRFPHLEAVFDPDWRSPCEIGEPYPDERGERRVRWRPLRRQRPMQSQRPPTRTGCVCSWFPPRMRARPPWSDQHRAAGEGDYLGITLEKQRAPGGRGVARGRWGPGPGQATTGW